MGVLPILLSCGFCEQEGWLPVPSSFFGDLYRHGNRLEGIVEAVSGGGDDLVHHLHSPKDLAEDGVGSVQSAVVCDTDIKLGTIIVGVSRAVAFPWHFGHRNRPPFMRPIAGFRIQPVAGTARTVQGTVRVLAQGIAALNDESWNDSVEGGPIVEPHLGELEEVVDVARGVVRVEPNLDLAERRGDGGTRIYFLELHVHRG